MLSMAGKLIQRPYSFCIDLAEGTRGIVMTRMFSDFELNEWLQRLCEDQALEIIPGAAGELYIPLIMNDAAEVYCTLTDAVVPGHLPADLGDVTSAELVKSEARRGIILKAGVNNRTTIWYSQCLYEEELYQYHRIMHRWVKNNEHMRMLVYMIGTMWDKYEYLGESACSEMELSLLPLMEYRPFRLFSPIEESLDGWYPDTASGYETMKVLAEEAGDASLLRLMKMGKVSGRLLDHQISRQLSASQSVFTLIYNRIACASAQYKPRKYTNDMQNDIDRYRHDIHHKFMEAGFTGTYPAYTRENSEVTVFEEHPFTVPEMDDLAFDVHFLVYDHSSREEPYRTVDAEEFKKEI